MPCLYRSIGLFDIFISDSDTHILVVVNYKYSSLLTWVPLKGVQLRVPPRKCVQYTKLGNLRTINKVKADRSSEIPIFLIFIVYAMVSCTCECSLSFLWLKNVSSSSSSFSISSVDSCQEHFTDILLWLP